MKSHTTKRFRKAFQQLPSKIQHKAQKAYTAWKKDPWNPRFHFKQVHSDRPIYSIRIDRGWRAVGVQKQDAMIWFWIGSHADYDKLISQA